MSEVNISFKDLVDYIREKDFEIDTLRFSNRELSHERDKYKSVLDEIREYCNKYGSITPQEQDILQILDKVKEHERGTTESSKS
jgi:capsule polysaccharide export protein KpsE/RkpR